MITKKHHITSHYKSSKESRSLKTNRKTKNSSTKISSISNIRESNIHNSNGLGLTNKAIIDQMNYLFASNSYKDVKYHLEELYKLLIVPDTTFQTITSQITLLDKSGGSGALIGILKTDKNQVIKIYDNLKSTDGEITYNKCIKISNKFNEIFINLLLSNIDSIIKIKLNESLLIKKHILPLIVYGISSKGSFITIPLIGISTIYKGIQYRITNLRELLDINHLELLKKSIITKRDDILAKYDVFITDKISSYIKVINILQKYLSFVNTDVKLTNVFIQETKANIPSKYGILEKYGFITNFECIISDLEKTSIHIGKYKIITRARSPLKVKILTKIGKGLAYDVRYMCDDYIKSCEKISIMDFDILSLIIDLLVQLLRLDSDFMKYIPQFSGMIKKFINPNLYNTLLEILKNGKYRIDKNYSYHISNIIFELCKKI